jgi:hypothetical protein
VKVSLTRLFGPSKEPRSDFGGFRLSFQRFPSCLPLETRVLEKFINLRLVVQVEPKDGIDVGERQRRITLEYLLGGRSFVEAKDHGLKRDARPANEGTTLRGDRHWDGRGRELEQPLILHLGPL